MYIVTVIENGKRKPYFFKTFEDIKKSVDIRKKNCNPKILKEIKVRKTNLVSMLNFLFYPNTIQTIERTDNDSRSINS